MVADQKSDDPLCKLHIQKQLRIYSIVMNASSIAKEFHFTPTTDYVYNFCKARKITFRTGSGIARTKGKNYEEFVMMCHIKKVTEFAFMYLSRAYKSQMVFTYRVAETGEIYLDRLAIDVREVIDNV